MVSAKQLGSLVNPSEAKALALSLTTDDNTLMVFSEDRLVRCISLNYTDHGWKTLENVFVKIALKVGNITRPGASCSALMVIK